MRSISPLIPVLCLLLTLATGGCRRSAGNPAANAELEKAASALAATEATPAPGPAPDAGPAPAQQMKQAVQAYKGGNFEEAVSQLQKLRATSAMTPQQHMALNDAMAAVMADIYALAAKGDSRAIQAVKQYEKLQTQKR